MNPTSDVDQTSRHLPSTDRKLRWRTGALIPFVIAFGLACKKYQGLGSDLINNFGPASVAYVVLLSLLLFAVWPKPDWIIQISVAAFVLTCVVEFLQLWHPAGLTAIRETMIGRLVLGTTFNVLDFPAYAIGAIVSIFVLKATNGSVSKAPSL
ncbi:MAG: DUF2809 domain-containing protein [Fuerstiella sp.]